MGCPEVAENGVAVREHMDLHAVGSIYSSSSQLLAANLSEPKLLEEARENQAHIGHAALIVQLCGPDASANMVLSAADDLKHLQIKLGVSV